MVLNFLFLGFPSKLLKTSGTTSDYLPVIWDTNTTRRCEMVSYPRVHLKWENGRKDIVRISNMRSTVARVWQKQTEIRRCWFAIEINYDRREETVYWPVVIGTRYRHDDDRHVLYRDMLMYNITVSGGSAIDTCGASIGHGTVAVRVLKYCGSRTTKGSNRSIYGRCAERE